MNPRRRVIMEQAQRLIDNMPINMVEEFADRLEQMPGWSHLPSSQAHVLRTLSHPHYRDLAQNLLMTWQEKAPEITP